MKFIKLTQVINESYYNTVPIIPTPTPIAQAQASNQSQQQQNNSISSFFGGWMGSKSATNIQTLTGGLQINLSTPPYQNIYMEKYSYPEIYINLEQIHSMKISPNTYYGTTLNGSFGTFEIKETPEQILKIIHNDDFNKKMDDILSE